MGLSALADASTAVTRLSDVFEAEIMMDAQNRDPTLPVAIDVEDASFAWDSPPPEEKAKEHKRFGHRRKSIRKASAEVSSEEKPEKPFSVENISFTASRGTLLAIVGRVGAGKSSLLQGIIGEMRKTAGTVSFGGSVAYCPQSAWIQVRSIIGIGASRSFIDNLFRTQP